MLERGLKVSVIMGWACFFFFFIDVAKNRRGFVVHVEADNRDLNSGERGIENVCNMS